MFTCLASAPAAYPDCNRAHRRPLRQERAERLASRRDSVPRWHRSSSVIGAGPSGYVYQVTAKPALTKKCQPGLPARLKP